MRDPGEEVEARSGSMGLGFQKGGLGVPRSGVYSPLQGRQPMHLLAELAEQEEQAHLTARHRNPPKIEVNLAKIIAWHREESQRCYDAAKHVEEINANAELLWEGDYHKAIADYLEGLQGLSK